MCGCSECTILDFPPKFHISYFKWFWWYSDLFASSCFLFLFAICFWQLRLHDFARSNTCICMHRHAYLLCMIARCMYIYCCCSLWYLVLIFSPRKRRNISDSSSLFGCGSVCVFVCMCEVVDFPQIMWALKLSYLCICQEKPK